MIEVKHTLPNARDLQRKLESLPPKVAARGVKTATFRAAQMLRDAMKARLQANGSVITGNLLRSIKARRSKGKPGYAASKVGPSAFYAYFVELGHKFPNGAPGFVMGKPFVGPTFLENQNKIGEVITLEINAIMNETLPGGVPK